MGGPSKKSKLKQKAIIKRATATFTSGKYFHWAAMSIFLLSFILYGNTLWHDYTQDDAIVIYDNMYTSQGIKGIPGLLTKDTFHGFFKTEGKSKLVSGGRYRPATPVMFAIEYQIFGKNPFWGHLFNILWYIILGITIYLLLIEWFGKDGSMTGYWLSLTATLLFIAHPIHTEVVANIKGRDEIISLLGSTVALLLLLKSESSNKKYNRILAAVAFFVALMSKENAITFLAVAPLAFVMLSGWSLGKAIQNTGYLLAAAVVFLLIRTSVLGIDFGGAPMELMNNPFIKWVGGQYVPFSASEKMATIMYTLGKYVSLLIFPHPLTNDYYPRHVGIMSFSDWQVLLSILVYGVLIYLASSQFSKNKILSFSLLYFFITLSIVSNVLFPVGTNMSERFLFMPSLAFVTLLSWLLIKYFYRIGQTNVNYFSIIGLILIAYGYKTIDRNFAWKDDFTLFTTDVKVSTNSAKALNAAGGALTTAASKEKDEIRRKELLNEAVGYLSKALEIHPRYKNAALLLGNAYLYLGDYDKSIASYERALQMDENFIDARQNLAVAYREAAKYAGEILNDISVAEQYLQKSLALVPNDPEALRLMGLVYGLKGNHQLSANFFLKAIENGANSANVFFNLGKAYEYLGNQNSAKLYYQKAYEKDPEMFKQFQQ